MMRNDRFSRIRRFFHPVVMRCCCCPCSTCEGGCRSGVYHEKPLVLAAISSVNHVDRLRMHLQQRRVDTSNQDSECKQSFGMLWKHPIAVWRKENWMECCGKGHYLGLPILNLLSISVYYMPQHVYLFSLNLCAQLYSRRNSGTQPDE